MILVAGTRGQLAGDVRPLVRFNVSVIVEQDGRREQAMPALVAATRWPNWSRAIVRLKLAREAVRGIGEPRCGALRPPDMMPVVLGPGWPGVLLHEAIGHGLEGDFNRKGTSAFTRPRRQTRGSPREFSPWWMTARCRAPRLA